MPVLKSEVAATFFRRIVISLMIPQDSPSWYYSALNVVVPSSERGPSTLRGLVCLQGRDRPLDCVLQVTPVLAGCAAFCRRDESQRGVALCKGLAVFSIIYTRLEWVGEFAKISGPRTVSQEESATATCQPTEIAHRCWCVLVGFVLQASGTELKPPANQAFREHVRKKEQRMQSEVHDPNHFQYLRSCTA